MDKTDTAALRRARLQLAIDTWFGGNASALARAAGKPSTQIADMLAGRKAFGEKVARQIEEALSAPPCSMPKGWLDGEEYSERATVDTDHFEDAGVPGTIRRVPIVGMAKLGDDGYYEELSYPTGHGDGWVESYSRDQNAYALRVKGDSMHPAIRHGQIVVVSPNSSCMPGAFVLLALRDGRKMVKELVMERTDEITVESVNGGSRLTLERGEIEKMHAISSIVFPHQWRPD